MGIQEAQGSQGLRVQGVQGAQGGQGLQAGAAAEGGRAAEQVEVPPCQNACPVLTDVRGYLQLVSMRRYSDAFDLIQSVNPFPSVCGRICHHPCEKECRRNKLEEPLAIRQVKRFVAERCQVHRKRAASGRRKPWRREAVAVIGAGPSGLAAANDLAANGFPVTVFERMSRPGGMLTGAIPAYRLPLSTVMEDVEDVAASGVQIVTGVDVGRDVSVSGLLGQGFRAVLVAVGLTESRTLNIPGVDSPGVLLAMPFLKALAYGERPRLGSRIIVIGGGNVAVDVARSAMRLGVTDVTMVCLESWEEMPAWRWEIEEALEEGIKIVPSWGPREIVVGEGGIRGLSTKAVKAVFDENRRFNPTFYEDRLSFVEGDTVIISIGQASDLSLAKGGSELPLNERRLLVFDKATMRAAREGVFACGEVVTGPGAAIEAVASGQRAARMVGAYLEGETLDSVALRLDAERKSRVVIAELPDEIVGKLPKQKRQVAALVAVAERVAGFSEIEPPFTEFQGVREARRCMSCGAGAMADKDRCAACLTCVRSCPFDVPRIEHNAAVFPSDMCQACGVCMGECPAVAIDMKSALPGKVGEAARVAARSASEADGARPVVVVVRCTHHPAGSFGYPSGTVEVELPCAPRLDVVDVLAAFENGAQRLCVITCRQEQCRYVDAIKRLRHRMKRAEELLHEAGLAGAGVRMVEVDGDSPDSEKLLLAVREACG